MTSSTQANSTPQVAVNDIGSEEAFLAAIDETIKYFNDGDIVEGTVDQGRPRTRFSLDIGYKTEGRHPLTRGCPSRPRRRPLRASVETGEHRSRPWSSRRRTRRAAMILSKKRAQYERAWGAHRAGRGRGRRRRPAPSIEVVKGGLHRGHRVARLSSRASLVELRRVRDLHPYIGERRSRPRSSNSTRTATMSCCLAGPSWRKPSRSSVRRSSTSSSRVRFATGWCRRSSTSVPSSMSEGWTAWSTSPKLSVAARQPSVRGRHGRRQGQGEGARGGPRSGAHSRSR